MGIWDMDIPCAPILADITVNGRTVKAVAQPTKQAFLYVFDRVTGAAHLAYRRAARAEGQMCRASGIRLRSRFRRKPPAYERQGVAIDDLIDFTPELRAEAVKLVSRYKIGPLFTPPVVSKAEGPGHASLPTAQRRHQLAGRILRSRDAHVSTCFRKRNIDRCRTGAAVRIRRRFGYELHSRDCDVTGVRTLGRFGRWTVSGAGPPGARASGEGGGGGLTVQGLPLMKPPYGQISAIDLNQGRDPLADRARRDAGQYSQQSRAQGPRTFRAQDRPGMIGTLVTKTLVIAGEAGFFTTAIGPTRRDAARLRQGHRQRSGRGLHACAAERLAHDVHDERQAVHRGRHQGGAYSGRVAGVPAAELIENDPVLVVFELLGIDAGNLAERGPVLDLAVVLPILNDRGGLPQGQHEARLQIFSRGRVHVYFGHFRAEICCKIIDDRCEFFRRSGGSTGNHVVYYPGPLLFTVVLGEQQVQTVTGGASIFHQVLALAVREILRLRPSEYNEEKST